MALRLVRTLSTSTSALSVELVLLVSTPSLSLSVSSTSPSNIFLKVFSVWSSKKEDTEQRTQNTQTLPTGVLLIISSIQLSSDKVNSSQSTPAHSLCQALGQCRRAKKATEQYNCEGAKNGGKRSGKRDTYPSLPSSRVFA